MNKPVIMCVDDEPQILDSLRRDLTVKYSKSFDIEICESAEEGLEVREETLSQGGKIGIYISDQRMPGMKGIEFLNKLEQDAGKILLTAYADTEVAIEGINNSCIDFYILKPYDKGLFDKIDHLISELAEGYYVVKVRTLEDRQKAWGLQNKIISEESYGGKIDEVKSNVEDPYAAFTDMYVAITNKEIIGTTSMNRVNHTLAQRRGTLFGLPIEEYYNLESIKDIDKRLVQLRSDYIETDYLYLGIGPQIWREIFRDTTIGPEAPTNHWILSARAQMADPRQTVLVYEKLKKTKIFNPDYEVQLKSDLQESIDFDEGEINNIMIPPSLYFYSAFGFKVIGKPCFIDRINDHIFPMLVSRKTLRQPFRSLFLSK